MTKKQVKKQKTTAAKKETVTKTTTPSKAAQIAKEKENKKEEKAKEEKIIKGILKGSAIVDHLVPDGNLYYVLPDVTNEINGLAWSETLNYSDVRNNNNKFYILQLLIQEKTDQVFFYKRWGRIGYDGQRNLVKYPSIAAAKADFLYKYQQKTEYGYIRLNIDFNSDAVDPAETGNSGLDSRVERLVKMIFDMKLINSQMKEIGYNTDITPLGKLGKSTLSEANAILKEIEDELRNKTKRSLANLSSQFYSLIPHSFGFKKMSNFIISTEQALYDKMDMLKALADIEITAKIIENNREGDNFIKSNYDKLNRTITPVERGSDIYKLLEQFVDQSNNLKSYQSFSIIEAFEMQCDKENERFKDYGNRKLLWYGSRVSNYVGILSQGLRIAPKEAPSTGFSFGKGIYLSDMCLKSAYYCHPINNEALILLCETSVGNARSFRGPDYSAADLPAGIHSTLGMGVNIPDPKGSVWLDGVEVPLGKAIKNQEPTQLGYNEYIVYDVAQIKLKYLVKLRFEKN